MRCSTRDGFTHNRDSGGLGQGLGIDILVLEDDVPATPIDVELADQIGRAGIIPKVRVTLGA